MNLPTKHTLYFFACIAFYFLGGPKSSAQTVQQLESMRNLNYAYETHFQKLSNNLEIAYVDEGEKSKPTLLFIHGLGSYLPAWRNNIAVLKSQYRCIAIDLPGYGKSSKGNYRATLPWFAEVIHEFCDSLKLESVHLGGHSMGGQIAIVTALAYPQLVSKLLLFAPAGFETFHEGQKEWFRNVFSAEMVRLTTLDQIKVNYAYNFYNFPADANFMIEDRIAMRSATDFAGYCFIIPECVKAMVDYPVFDYLKNITQPTLVVYGQNDQLIPNRFLTGGTTKAIAEKGANEIKNHTLVLVKKAGHFVQFEQSEQVNAAIIEFMKK